MVVHAQEGLPGSGFFACARELNVLKSRKQQDELAFFVEELRRVHRYWARTGPVQPYGRQSTRV